MDLNEMSINVLRKIEELTSYLIELKTQNNVLKKQIMNSKEVLDNE